MVTAATPRAPVACPNRGCGEDRADLVKYDEATGRFYCAACGRIFSAKRPVDRRPKERV